MTTTKKELRSLYKNLRRELSREAVDEKSLAIANRLLELPIWKKRYFHVFLPIEAQNEVNTEFLLHLLAGKDKEIIISRSDFESRSMTHILLTDSTAIRINAYGIPEPVDGIEIPDSKIEVVFTPLLAFDTKGNRIGYGMGFYDNFLKKCTPETLKIGLSFFEAAAAWEDVSENDIGLDYCITPEKTYVF